MSIARLPASLSRKTVSAVLVFLLGASSVLALATPAAAVISVDDVTPNSGAISTNNPSMGMNANITGQEAVSVSVDSSSEWSAGTFDDTLMNIGAGGQLRLNNLSRDDFSLTGPPSDVAWEYGDTAVESNGFLDLSSDSASGVDMPYIRTSGSLITFNVANLPLASTPIHASVELPQLTDGTYVVALGLYDGGSGAWAGIVYYPVGPTDPANFTMLAVYNSPMYGWNEMSFGIGAFGQSFVLSIGGTNTGQSWFTTCDGSGTEVCALHMEADNGQGAQTVDLDVDVTEFANAQAFGGRLEPLDGGIPEDFFLRYDAFWLDPVFGTIWAPSATYESAPIATGLYHGSFITRIDFTTADGGMNGIGAVTWHTAMNDTGPWTAYAAAPVNLPISVAAEAFVQFTIRLSAFQPTPSWPDSVVFSVAYRTEVGSYALDDFPGSGSINTDAWTASSTAVTGAGLDLNSASSSTSIGVSWTNKTWLLADTHSVKTLTAVSVMNGESVSSGGSGDQNVLLSGFTAKSGGSQTGYIGVIRIDDSVNAYWGVVWDDGTGRSTQYDGLDSITGSGQAIIQTSLVDGMFHAWVVEVDNAWRGWLDLGSFDWGATVGTAEWRIGDIGSHSGSQRAVVDWAALELRSMTPVFGEAWTAGNVNINEDQNTRAVVAISGPTWDINVVDYRLDTTAPTGTMVLNNGIAYTANLKVPLTLSASDRWGVRYYAASESLSFPEGWIAMDTSAEFDLSAGDGRKVVWVRFMDTSGVISEPINASVILDSQAPTGAIYIANRTAYTNSYAVQLTLLAFDGNGLKTLHVHNEGGVASTFDVPQVLGLPQPSVSMNVQWNLLSTGDGEKKVYLAVEDVAGLMSREFNDTILVDLTPPALTVNLTNGVVRGGITYVNSATLRLNVESADASGVDRVEVSEVSDFSVNTTYDGPGSVTYEVEAQSGPRTVFVRAFDIYGLSSPVRQLDFYVDVSPPTGSVDILYTGQSAADLDANIAGCCNSTTLAKGREVVLAVTADDNVGVAEVQFSTSLYFPGATWLPFNKARYWFELSANDGTGKTVYVRFKDVNGRESQAFFDQIDMDTTKPVGSIIINSGDISTIDPLLSLSLEGSDNFAGDLQMRMSLTPDFNGSTWLPFSDTQRLDARTTAGEVTVYYQLRDANGLESLTYSDKITVRQPTCQELGSCTPLAQPGFEGAGALIAILAVAGIGLVARRRRL